MKTELETKLATALRELLALHEDSVFVCGIDDEAKVDAALDKGVQAVAAYIKG